MINLDYAQCSLNFSKTKVPSDTSATNVGNCTSISPTLLNFKLITGRPYYCHGTGYGA